jgi:hypothetical protein
MGQEARTVTTTTVSHTATITVQALAWGDSSAQLC